MRRYFIVLALLVVVLPSRATAQLGSVQESLLVHLNLSLAMPARAPVPLLVRIHATDRINDTYYTSQDDPSQNASLDWQQDLPLSVSDTSPLRLIFQITTEDGSPPPAGYAIQWQYSTNGSFQYMAGNTVTIPAGSSGDMDLTVRGTVVAAQ